MTDELDPSIAGRISPPDDGEGAPIFEVIGRREDYRLAPGHIGDLPANVRPCDHTTGKITYVLDEKWHTVTCSKCQQQVPAFAVLMLYAEWSQRYRSQQESTRRAHRDFLMTRARYLSKLKGITDPERAELQAAIKDAYRMEWRAVAAIVDRVEDAIEGRRHEAARKRHPVKGHLPPTKVFGG